MSISLSLLQTYSDNRALRKSYNGLYTTTCTIKAPCSIIDPVFVIEYTNDALNANYCYCSNLGRYYFVKDRILATGGRIELHCHVDVLMSFQSAIQSLTTDIVRYEGAGINYVPDNMLPIYPQKQARTIAFDGAPFNLSVATGTSFNFVLNVSGGAGTSPTPTPNS